MFYWVIGDGFWLGLFYRRSQAEEQFRFWSKSRIPNLHIEQN